MRFFSLVVGALIGVLAAEEPARAQASIAGIVKDASGTALRGVRVEALSPEPSDRQRAVQTDGTGHYRIIDLRPGTYSVTFTLDGFRVIKREGIELSGAFTATVNADLKAGAAGEVITIVHVTATVDVQSATRQTTVSNELLNAIPTARTYAGLMMLVPAIVPSTTNSQVTPRMIGFSGLGGRGPGEGRLEIDGLSTGFVGGNGASPYVADIQNAREVTFTITPGLGEAEVSAPVVSVVPQAGGNAFHGTLYTGVVTKGMVGSNLSQALIDAGMTTPNSLEKFWDVNAAAGGPIVIDRLWFFGSVRDQGSHRNISGLYANLNAGDPTKWTYAPDLTRPAQSAGSWTIGTLRLTAQVTPRNKINLHWDEQAACAGAGWAAGIDACRDQPSGGSIIAGGSQNNGLAAANTPTTAPETATYIDATTPQRVQQMTWQSPVTNRLMLDAAFGTYLLRAGGQEMPGSPTGDLIRITEQCTSGCAANGGIAGLVYRSPTWANNWNGRYNWRAASSYVTGALTLKAGYQGGYLESDNTNFINGRNLTYRVNNGVPNQLTQHLHPFTTSTRARYDAAYAQVQQTRSGLTLQGAIRFDRARSWFPRATIGPTQFLPAPIAFPETKGVDAYTDISPRVAAAYDLFGDARTSIKINVGRYLQVASTGATYGGPQPTSRLTTLASRSWTDANRNFTPDCDLLNPSLQDLRDSGGDLCAQISDLAFGTPIFSDSYRPGRARRMGCAAGGLELRRLRRARTRPRVTVEAGYYRRWLVGFTVTDNVAQAPSDFGAFSITAPVDPRLPGGGGYTISGLFDANQNVASSFDNYITASNRYGSRWQHYNGLLVGLNMRLVNGVTFRGGLSAGKTVSDSCENRALLPETAPVNPYCHNDSGLVTRVTALGTYTIPRLDVQVAGTFRSDPGAALVANYVVPNSAVAPSLGRNLSNGAPNVTVNLIEPGSMYGDRVNEVSIRVARVIRAGRSRVNIGIDVYNLLNAAPVLDYNPRFIPGGTGPWTTPIQILQPRYAKVSAQVDF